jgi:catechol 2,3-dioxygenase-like lactoylglutathione lyase family enzyme
VSTGIQVTFDCADPDALARFWCEALGYRLPEPPAGFASWPDWLAGQGIPAERWNDASAAIDPHGQGPRLYFQRVPEGKTAKNRVHLDVNVGRDAVEATLLRLAGHGATVVRPPSAGGGAGEFWAVLADPEGNEFCLQ